MTADFRSQLAAARLDRELARLAKPGPEPEAHLEPEPDPEQERRWRLVDVWNFQATFGEWLASAVPYGLAYGVLGRPPVAESRPAGEVASGLARRVAAASGAVTVASFVLLRVATGMFYRRAGAAPEDVSLAQTELFARSIGYAVALVVIGGFFAAFTGMFIFGEFSGCGAVLLLWALGAVVGLLVVHVMLGASTTTGYLVWVVFFWASVAAFPVVTIAHILGREVTSVQRVWVTVVAIVALIGAVSWLLAKANSQGDATLDGKGAGAWWYPWSAEVVEVGWKDPANRPRYLGGMACGVYLGTADATAIIVDPVTDQTIRVPAGEVVLTQQLGRGRSSRCAAWTPRGGHRRSRSCAGATTSTTAGSLTRI